MFQLQSNADTGVATTYVDDVFSTYLYTGNSAFPRVITNGIDLAGNGGLVWTKCRNSAIGNRIQDTVRGATKELITDSTAAETTQANSITAFGNSGYTLGATTWDGDYNSAFDYVSWTFRKAPKFFDVVTYTGNGANRTVAHSLGQVPGMILVKRTDVAGTWMVYHNSLANTENLVLNTTAAKVTNATAWNSTTATSSVFSLGTHADVNTNSGTYVAYLFAHDTSADGIIQCGGYVGTGAQNKITLGWEPQFIIIKPSAISGGSWRTHDNMRGIGTGGVDDAVLLADSSNGETLSEVIDLNPDGFTITNTTSAYNLSGSSYIYLAIRRPNKPPTSGTQVYNAIARTGTGVAATVTTGFVSDMAMVSRRSAFDGKTVDRMRGNPYLVTNATAAEATTSTLFPSPMWDVQDGFRVGTAAGSNSSGIAYINWSFRRAPGFFDVVCYTGTGSATTVAHNLGVAPELMILKARTGVHDWSVYHAALGAQYQMRTNFDIIPDGPSSTYWNTTAPTASVFSVGISTATNASGVSCIAYLFATLPGISKVGSYTGNGTSQTINCGFAAGARFVLVKRTDSTGDWFVWDTARGIVAANDPHLSLNTTTAEVTTDDSIDPDSSGFVVNQLAATNVNVNGASYIFLAIA